jgi:hypothetical protein
MNSLLIAFGFSSSLINNHLCCVVESSGQDLVGSSLSSLIEFFFFQGTEALDL